MSAIQYLLLLLAMPGFGQESKPPSQQDTGYIGISREHVPWPSPESLVSDLRSKDEQVRLKALRLVGFDEHEAHIKLYAAGTSSPVGEAVVTPDEIELQYAALGEDSTQQAIIAVEADQTQSVVVAVGLLRNGGWERIATSSCWCKYEMYGGRDALAESVTVAPTPEPGPPVPEHFELVLRVSGGGTGIYTQNEGHFRVYHGELRLVMTFVSRQRRCNPTMPSPHYCEVEKRWFLPTAFGNTPEAYGIRATVVESHGRMPTENTPEVVLMVRDLEDRYLGPPSCSTYAWDAKVFQYVPLKTPDPCQPVKP